jgi:hypothetical protein
MRQLHPGRDGGHHAMKGRQLRHCAASHNLGFTEWTTRSRGPKAVAWSGGRSHSAFAQHSGDAVDTQEPIDPPTRSRAGKSSKRVLPGRCEARCVAMWPSKWDSVITAQRIGRSDNVIGRTFSQHALNALATKWVRQKVADLP